MDASNWQILDTYQLDEYEHEMSMKIMTLFNVSLREREWVVFGPGDTKILGLSKEILFISSILQTKNFSYSKHFHRL